MTNRRVVLDTNIYLSGIIFGGNCRHILDLMIKKKIRVIISPAILLEISQKLKQKFKWSQNQIFTVIKTLIKSTKVIQPKIKIRAVKMDKSDDKIIEAAVAGRTNYIVSGDQHLLKIKQYQKIKIVTPTEFLSIYLKK
ncbi:putative toxin-antitoxin system toxin component, PIN family [Candidatus Berkelbacteria bacterium CG_4_8_14_3_um_filter_39_27]|nr:MAG: putative toxin-antitoxin system toxin component, PIN family [Candidatus Berkelbacteria bacterium CG_4_8_14_3_um_filter_39_27]